MRELSLVEVEEVSGGFGWLDSVTYGSAIGGVGYGAYVIALGATGAAVTAAFGAGVAVGGIIGGISYGAYATGRYFRTGSLDGDISSSVSGQCQ